MPRKTKETPIPTQIQIVHQTVIENRPDEGELPGRPSRIDGVEGVDILFRRTDPDMRKSEEAVQLAAAEVYVPIANAISRLTAAAKPHKDILIEGVKTIEGYRGIQRIDEQGNGFRQAIALPETIDYAPDGLKEGLGELYGEVVSKTEAVLTVVVPEGTEPELFISCMALVLKGVGVDEKDIPAHVSAIIKTYVNEGRVQELMSKGAANFPEGTRQVTPGTPSVKPPKVITASTEIEINDANGEGE